MERVICKKNNRCRKIDICPKCYIEHPEESKDENFSEQEEISSEESKESKFYEFKIQGGDSTSLYIPSAIQSGSDKGKEIEIVENSIRYHKGLSSISSEEKIIYNTSSEEKSEPCVTFKFFLHCNKEVPKLGRIRIIPHEQKWIDNVIEPSLADETNTEDVPLPPNPVIYDDMPELEQEDEYFDEGQASKSYGVR